jgi:hypothetical protein
MAYWTVFSTYKPAGLLSDTERKNLYMRRFRTQNEYLEESAQVCVGYLLNFKSS